MALSFVVNKAEFTENAEDLGGTFEPLPAGNYEVALVDAKIKKYAGKGQYVDTDAYHLTWKITDQNEQGVNRRLWSRVALIPKWLPKNGATTGSANFTLSQFAHALGIVPDDKGRFELPEADEILDQDVTIGVEVIVREFNGKESNEINRYLSPEQLAKRQADAVPVTQTETKGAVKNNGLFV